MASKGPLDSFYKDSLRVGNLKVRRCSNEGEAAAPYHIVPTGRTPAAAAVLHPLQSVLERQRGVGSDHLPWALAPHYSATNGTPHTAGVSCISHKAAGIARPAQQTFQHSLCFMYCRSTEQLPPASPASHESDVNNPEVTCYG